MLSCVIHGAHDLRLEEREIPKPGSNEVLVRLGAGGICGSDLHYFHDGGVADFRIRQPMILGHEVAGEVVQIGPDVSSLKPGNRVAVNPARYCGRCKQCLSGRGHLCSDVRFFGSASRFPHMQGGFAEYFVASETQCVRVAAEISFPELACAEPLAVALHAVNQAGNLNSKKVLITGAGPIGLLVGLAARFAGALEVTITDRFSTPLTMAEKLGLDYPLNVAENPDALKEAVRERGEFDVALEASGAVPAMLNCLESVGPAGRIVQVGMLSSAQLPLGRIISREIEFVGTFRFYQEYANAVHLIEKGRINVGALITHQLPLASAIEAFGLASDKAQSIKVSLVSSKS
jgi:L-idonate 5-dehydrogenase